MGLWNAIKQGASRVVGMVGNTVRKIGEFGAGVARRVQENAGSIANGIGNIVGGSVGNTIKGLGGTVSNIANTVGNVARSVANVGSSMTGRGPSYVPPDTARQLG